MHAAWRKRAEEAERVLGKGEADMIPQWHDRTQMYADHEAVAQAMKAEITDLRAALDSEKYERGEVERALIYWKAKARTAPASATRAPSDAKPDAWMKADSDECTSAASKLQMEQAGFGVWDSVAVMYTRPLFFQAPTAPAPRASIADDAEFCRLLEFHQRCWGSDSTISRVAIAAYVDQRIETIIKGGSK